MKDYETKTLNSDVKCCSDSYNPLDYALNEQQNMSRNIMEQLCSLPGEIVHITPNPNVIFSINALTGKQIIDISENDHRQDSAISEGGRDYD